MYQDLWVSAGFLIAAIIVGILYRDALKAGATHNTIDKYYLTPNKDYEN